MKDYLDAVFIENADAHEQQTKLKNSSSPEQKVFVSSQIILAFRKGDHHAFETLFHMFYSKVKTFLRVITKMDHLAEELSQQVFVDLWIHREKVDPDKNISAYIYTMARNAAITALKKQLRYESFDFNYEEEIYAPLTDDELIAKETELLINLTVAAMPARRKQVYEMSRMDHKSNEEISTELNISRKVVEKHIRLAIKELKEVIGVMSFFFYS